LKVISGPLWKTYNLGTTPPPPKPRATTNTNTAQVTKSTGTAPKQPLLKLRNINGGDILRNKNNSAGSSNLPGKESGWGKEQDQQAQLRREAYTQTPSIFRDPVPQVSIYGAVQEPTIRAGSSVPEVYTTNLTSTAVQKLAEENRKLQNLALDREQPCNICYAALPAGPHNEEARRVHLRTHADVLGLGPSATDKTDGSGPEVFYCEICGKTDAQYKEDGGVGEHGEECGKKGKFNEFPLFCQYCGVSFEQLDPEAAKKHEANCATGRRCESCIYCFIPFKLSSQAAVKPFS
jgi:hypothetical protein